jgi:hypothetical protein
MEGLRWARRPTGRVVSFVLRTFADGLRQQGSALRARLSARLEAVP